jgi:hypothetical protein
MLSFPIINFHSNMCYDCLTITMNRRKSINKLLSHLSLDSTFSKVTNSTSIVDLATQVWLEDFQEAACPTYVN